MAKKASLRLDSKGLNKALQALAPQIQAVGQKVADGVPNAQTGVEMGLDRNGRPLVMVAITEPKGLALQARTGALTRAAAAQGLDIHRYPLDLS